MFAVVIEFYNLNIKEEKEEMCDCFTNPNGDKVFCSILCRDYYMRQNPDRAWRYYCKWCSTEKTLQINDWCSTKCFHEYINPNIQSDSEYECCCLLL